MAVRWTAEHQHCIARLDIDGQDLQAVADVSLVKANHIQPECWPTLVLLLKLFCDCRQSKELGSSVVMPRVRATIARECQCINKNVNCNQDRCHIDTHGQSISTFTEPNGPGATVFGGLQHPTEVRE